MAILVRLGGPPWFLPPPTRSAIARSRSESAVTMIVTAFLARIVFPTETSSVASGAHNHRSLTHTVRRAQCKVLAFAAQVDYYVRYRGRNSTIYLIKGKLR